MRMLAAAGFGLMMLLGACSTAPPRQQAVSDTPLTAPPLRPDLFGAPLDLPRVEALHYGPGDYAASTGARTTAIGEQDPAYPGDLWHYPMSRILVAARANGLRALDGPWSRHADLEGLESAARRTAAMGFDGKWAIHPGQIETINAVFTPPEAEVAHARRILDAMARAADHGRGAATLDGRMIDVASVRQAEGLVAKADRIARRG